MEHHTSFYKKEYATLSFVQHRLMPSVLVSLVIALFVLQAPSFAQTESHQVELSLEDSDNRYRIEVANLLPPGPTTFNITNNTDVEQGLVLIGEGIEPFMLDGLAPGGSENVEIDLGEGVYFAYSPMLIYAAQGMETVIYVTNERINPATRSNSEEESRDDSGRESAGATDTEGATDAMTNTAELADSDGVLGVLVNENYTTFVEVLRATNLLDTLQGEGPYTVFAPTNEAFEALPQDTLDDFMNSPQGYLSQIALYHIVEGELRAADLNDGQIMDTLQGSRLVVAMEPGSIHVNDATIVTSDLESSNGVVHIIDSVLLPVTDEEPNADVAEAEGAATSDDPVEGDEVTGEGEIEDNETDDEDVGANGEENEEGEETIGTTSGITGTSTMTGTGTMTGTDPMTGTATMTETVVLRAGERVITQDEFNRLFLNTLRSFAAQTGLPLNQSTLPIFDELRHQFLAELALRETLLAEAERRGIEVQDAEIENIVMNAKQNFVTDQLYLQALHAAGFEDETEFRSTVRQEAILERMMTELRIGITVSEDEINSFYQDNLNLFRTGPGVILPLEMVREQVVQALELRKVQEAISGMQTDAGIETFGGNLAPLIEVLQQSLPSIQGSEVMTDTGTMTDTISGMSDVRTAKATLMDVDGEVVGLAVFTQVDDDPVQIEVQFDNAEVLDAGSHGIHIHTNGSCTPNFDAAGSHLNPEERQHGLENPDGPHAGDLPNLVIRSGISDTFTTVTDRITLGDGIHSLFDADGSALVLHADLDDQVSDPAGESGERIACGVIEPDTNSAADAMQ